MRLLQVIAVTAMLGASVPAIAQMSVGVRIGLPSVRIGIQLGGYPDLVEVPGYPVYYASHMSSNFFFYDGPYWVLADDGWYSSDWYDGPWDYVEPVYVPLFILRVPVRYYRRPPPFFRGWDRAGPPRWGEHWGRDWDQRRSGWNRWNHAAVPARAPLPTYQRDYSGDRYPRAEQQRELRDRNYHYQAREPVARPQVRPQARSQPAREPPQQHPAERRTPQVEQRRQPEQHPQQEPRRQPAQPQPTQRAAPNREPSPQPHDAKAARQSEHAAEAGDGKGGKDTKDRGRGPQRDR